MPCRELGSMEFYLGKGILGGFGRENKLTETDWGRGRREEERRGAAEGRNRAASSEEWVGRACPWRRGKRVGGAYFLKEQGADREGQHNHTHMTQPVQLLKGQILGPQPRKTLNLIALLFPLPLAIPVPLGRLTPHSTRSSASVPATQPLH